MSSLRVLAFSSSRVGKSDYLQSAAVEINTFLGDTTLNIAFVPFAAANKKYEDYVNMVKGGLKDLPYNLDVVLPQNAKATIEQGDVIMVGGGNTFKLLHDIYDLDLFSIIQQKVQAGTPYIGWSAGSNITGLTISTTNDMPIIEPKSFKAFGFFPFQINPHYINLTQEGHNGETRDQRLTEFLEVNPGVPVVGLPEGTALHLEGSALQLRGQQTAVLFEHTQNGEFEKKSIELLQDLSFLLK